MQHFYVLGFSKWKRWTIIILLAMATATYIWFEKDGVFSVFSEDSPTALSKGNPNESNIALTFNVSWGDDKIDEILAQLKKDKVKATFFLSGEWAERHPDLVEKIVENNHELGMLGYRYKSYLDQEIGQVKKDLLHAREVFHKLGYEDIDLLRAPSGHFNKEILKLAEQLDFKVIQWNVNPNDWKNPGTEVIIDHVLKETSNGDIILLHASDSAKQTAHALDIISSGLKAKDFQFITISELINQAHPDAKLVK